jgi:MFS family permease
MAADTENTDQPEVVSSEAASVDKRSFWSLFGAAFQEAFNDLAFRTLVTFFVLGIGLSQAQRDGLVSLTLLLFALPFILFSMLGGYFADRFSKRNVTLIMKAVEVCSMAVGVAALISGNVALLLAVVFLVSAQSAVFGPSKWGMLPEVLPESRLSWGNGLLQFGTYIAAIVGTIAGGFLSETFQEQKGWAGGVLMATAALGVAVSFGIRRLPAANPRRKLRIEVISDLAAQFRVIRGRPHLVARGPRQRLFPVPSYVAAGQYSPLRQGHSRTGRHAKRLPAGGCRRGNRRGELDCGVCLRQKD